MGKVYLAEDIELPRNVAIKSIRPEMKENEEVLKRIKRECQMHAAIGVHPHIVALHDKIEENNNLYLIMEYVDGEPLSKFFAEKKGLLHPDLYNSAVYDIIIQILDALSCIHRHNIIHRDIKPSNILIQTLPDNRLQAKLMDFGIARSDTDEQLALTQLTSLNGGGPGTPAYMAPERIDSQTYGKMCAATDIYSVGVILYELLSDNPPFNGTITEIFTGHLTKAPDFESLKSKISSEMLTVLEKSLKKYPNERYADASKMALDIKAAKNGIQEPNQTRTRTDEKTLLNTASSTPKVSNKPQGTLLDTKTGQKFDFKKDKKVWAAGGAFIVFILLVFVFWSMKGFSGGGKETTKITNTTNSTTQEKKGEEQKEKNGKDEKQTNQEKGKDDDNIIITILDEKPPQPPKPTQSTEEILKEREVVEKGTGGVSKGVKNGGKPKQTTQTLNQPQVNDVAKNKEVWKGTTGAR